MKYYIEESLRNFHFWSGGADRANLLTGEQLDQVEQMLEEIEPEEGWSDVDINDMFWFDFDTIAQWLGYKDEEHLEKGIDDDAVEEADRWAEEISEDYEKACEIAGLDSSDYFYKDDEDDEDEKSYLHGDEITEAFREWWGDLEDIEKVETYQEYE